MCGATEFRFRGCPGAYRSPGQIPRERERTALLRPRPWRDRPPGMSHAPGLAPGTMGDLVPTDLTLFAAQYLIFIDAALAAAYAAFSLYRQPRPDVLRWAITIGV